MKTAAFTWWTAGVCLLIMFAARSTYACEKKYIRFDATPEYDHKQYSDPRTTCIEHFAGGTRTVWPRYNNTDGTSPGAVEHSTRDGETGEWSASTDKHWQANDVGSKVTWNNGYVRNGAAETTFTFAAPTTPISYSVVFTTHSVMLENRTLVGDHKSSVTHAGGDGISVKTWALTTPQPNDVLGTQRAWYVGVTVKVHEKELCEGVYYWQPKYSLPKTE